MAEFNLTRLKPLTKSMFEGQQKWSDRNWKETVSRHYLVIEKLVEKTQVFALWKRRLGIKYHEVAKELIPEIFMDAYMSIDFACMGLYKQANICLRAQLETTLRLVYFSTHRVEFKWWQSGSEWYLGDKDVWGKGYIYFKLLKEFKEFDVARSDELFSEIRTFYKLLSHYVHSSMGSFQTKPNRISPKYEPDEFVKWKSNFNDVQKFVNVILALGFAETFKASDISTQRKILKVIENNDYKDRLRRSLNLRIPGRI
ncbi:MAG TPA: hypothetical protein ENH82_10495 [bacterium]|nr:hypothetical protein [bacterium]